MTVRDALTLGIVIGVALGVALSGLFFLLDLRLRQIENSFLRESKPREYYFEVTEVKPRSESQRQIDRLAEFIMNEVPGEPSMSQGAVETAIRLIRDNVLAKDVDEVQTGDDDSSEPTPK